MDRLQELIGALSDKDVLSRSYAAKHSHLCKICAKPTESLAFSSGLDILCLQRTKWLVEMA